MSKPIPREPMSEGMRQFLQDTTESLGYPYEIKLVRVSDTAVIIRMKGADGVWRDSSNITLT